MSVTHLSYFGRESDPEGPDGYQELVVAELRRFKRLGVSFDSAWAVATAIHKPPMMWRRHMGFPGEESPLEFMRRHCEHAWNGTVAAKPWCPTGDHAPGCSCSDRPRLVAA